MKKSFFIKCLFVCFLGCYSLQANAHMTFPFDAEGNYFNSEASIDDVKENHDGVFPAYRREMEFVRFDAIMIEKEYSYIWLGYSYEDEAYFYCYKHMSPSSDTTTKTYEEKWWFKHTGNTFKFYRTTIGVD
jgi:hypothetical protein